MIALIWFMQRQQKKQAQERQNQLNAIEKGDEVVTIGGMYAMVDEVDTAAKKIVLDVDGVYLPFELTAIKRVVTKGGTVDAPVEAEQAVIVEEPVIDTPEENQSIIEND